MPGRIRDEDIAEIRKRVKIEDIVNDYVTLKSAGGGTYKGLCPFHDEKSASFHVNPKKNYWHCLAAETKVMTMEGLVPIRLLAGTIAKVMDGYGSWVDAKFESYGVQHLLALTIANGETTQVIYATSEHRWFVVDELDDYAASREVFTKDLILGDHLISVYPRRRVNENNKHHHWRVLSVEETSRYEEVYCAVVPTTHSFVLEGNLLTGNCFGCSESGDAFSFLQKMDHIGFIEAVERLAERTGVILTYEDGKEYAQEDRGQRTRLLDAHKWAAKYYQEQMQSHEASKGIFFLTDRKFEADAIQRFGIGYAPKGWDGLTEYLKGKGYTEDELVLGGLSLKSEKASGKVYDRFRGRLVWPIKNAAGDVIGFGARKLYDDDDGPKYLNTPETPLYKKSQVLYGLDMARKEIAAKRQAIIVEGYTDVMACHLAGYPNAVAACGTAFGGDHISILRRLLMDDDQLTGEVIFTFDGDAAGQKAALRAFSEDQRFVARTMVAVEPNGMDPCEVRMAKGDAGVKELLDNKVPLFEFAIRSMLTKHDLSLPEGRVAALHQSAPVVAQIKDPALRPEYTRILAGWLGLDVSMVRREVNNASMKLQGQEKASSDAEATKSPAAASLPQDWVFEREALKCVLQAPVAASVWFENTEDTTWTNPLHKMIHSAVVAAGIGSLDGGEWVESVRSRIANEEASSLVAELAVDPLMSEEPAYVNSVIARVLELEASRSVQEIKGELLRAAPAEQGNLLMRLMELENYRKELLATIYSAG